MGSPEGKYLDIDRVSQNRIYAIKNHENSKKNGSRVLEFTPGGLPPRDKVLGLGEPYPSNVKNRIKSVLWFKSYSIFTTKLVIKPRVVV